MENVKARLCEVQSSDANLGYPVGPIPIRMPEVLIHSLIGFRCMAIRGFFILSLDSPSRSRPYMSSLISRLCSHKLERWPLLKARSIYPC